MKLLFLVVGLASAFVPPATLQQLSRASVASTSEVIMFTGNSKSSAKSSASTKSTKPVVSKGAKPLSPGSNYPTTKNIQTQKSGFGAFVQKFQLVKEKSKYGVPIFLPSGNVNPAYLAAERKELAAKSKANTASAEAKRKALVASKQFELADYVRKKIGNVGSGKDFYQSGR